MGASPLDRMRWAKAAQACPELLPAAKRLAICIADACNSQTGISRHGVPRLASDSGLCERSVQLGLRSLERDGWVAAVGTRAGGRKRPTQYRVLVERAHVRSPFAPVETVNADAPFQDGKGAIGDAKGCTDEQKRVNASAPGQGSEQEKGQGNANPSPSPVRPNGLPSSPRAAARWSDDWPDRLRPIYDLGVRIAPEIEEWIEDTDGLTAADVAAIVATRADRIAFPSHFRPLRKAWTKATAARVAADRQRAADEAARDAEERDAPARAAANAEAQERFKARACAMLAVADRIGSLDREAQAAVVHLRAAIDQGVVDIPARDALRRLERVVGARSAAATPEQTA